MTTYYLRQGGTAANKEAAIGPGSDASKCMNVSVHNGETFSAGDVIKVCDDGGDIRGQVKAPSAGSDGSPITYEAESGDSPVINGSDLVVTWGDEGGDVWSASFVPAGTQTTPAKVFFDGVLGTEETGGTGNLDGANEWYYNDGTNTLYVYSTSDPDTAYTDPGIEALSRVLCFWSDDTAYITVDGIDCTKANLNCIKVEGTGHTHIIKNLTLSHSGYSQGFLNAESASNPYLYNVTAHDCGVAAGDHGFYLACPTAANGTFVIENCTAYDNADYGFHIWRSGGGTIKYSKAYDNSTAGFLIGDLGDDVDVNIEYCISYSNTKYGFYVLSNGSTDNGNNTIQILNCVGYRNGTWYGDLQIDSNASANTTIIAKNCIFEHDAAYSLKTGANSAVFIFDYNCYYNNSGNMIQYAGDNYTQGQFAAYQAAKSQDANSISADPLFTDAANDDFTLEDNSPCINTGIDVGFMQDYAGNTVPIGSAPDIGAYESSVSDKSFSKRMIRLMG